MTIIVQKWTIVTLLLVAQIAECSNCFCENGNPSDNCSEESIFQCESIYQCSSCFDGYELLNLPGQNGLAMSFCTNFTASIYHDWDVSLARQIDFGQNIGWQVAFSDTSIYVAGRDHDGNGAAKSFNLNTGELENTYNSGTTNYYWSVAVTNDVVLVTEHNTRQVSLFRTDGQLLDSETSYYPYQIAVDGDDVFVGTLDEQRFFTLENSESLGTSSAFSNLDIMHAYAVAYDMNYVYLGGTESDTPKIFVIDRTSNDIIHRLVGHSNDIHQLRIYSDYLVSASYDDTITLWSKNSYTALHSISFTDHVQGMDVEDGYIFVVVPGKQIHIYNLDEMVNSGNTDPAKTIDNPDFHHRCDTVEYYKPMKQLFVGCWNGKLWVYQFS